MNVQVFSRFDVFLGQIGRDELLSFVHTDELNGEDSVAIETTYHLKEGYRLVWLDNLGNVHEHVCQDPKALHDSGMIVYTDTALNSICETFGDYIEDKRPYSYTYQKALEVALAPTRWTVGTVDKTGTVSSGLTFYHTSAREAIQAIIECGGELQTSITFSKGAITSRKVNILTHRGATSTHKRFNYSKDIVSVSKTEHYGAITACYGYGKGVETDSGGYGRKLTFGDVNNKKNYVTDETALKKYGRPDGKGGYAHVFGEYENSECEDAKTLLQETKDYLASHNEPGVTYEADVVDLVQFGRDWEGVSVGDEVQMVDTEFEPALRCAGRVSKLVTDMLGGSQTVTLGNVTETLSDIIANQQKTLNSLSTRTTNWDIAANTPAAYLQQIIDGLNEQFNTQGMSYCYTSFETGTIWASVPLDKNGKPTTTNGATAIQICSQGFRIADGVKADGSWNWRTFGTGKGFTADEITAGTIKGGSNYWNLNTGEMVFKQGNIRSADGQSEWDLSNNTFKTTNMNATNMTATNMTAKSSTFNDCTSTNMQSTNMTVKGNMMAGSWDKGTFLTEGGDLWGMKGGTRYSQIKMVATNGSSYGLEVKSSGYIDLETDALRLNGSRLPDGIIDVTTNLYIQANPNGCVSWGYNIGRFKFTKGFFTSFSLV